MANGKRRKRFSSRLAELGGEPPQPRRGGVPPLSRRGGVPPLSRRGIGFASKTSTLVR